MLYSLSEVLQKVQDAPTKEEKICLLRAHNSKSLQQLLDAVFNPNVKFLLPKGPVKYKPAPDGADIEGSLYENMKRMYLFVEGGHKTLTQKKREILFLQLLESVTPDDAKLLLSVKDKKLPYRSITLKLLKEAFPGS